MKYLLDTDVVVNHLRGKEKITAEVIEAGASISIITLAELYYGAYKSNQVRDSLKLVKTFLNDLTLEVLELKEKIAEVFGEIKASLEKEGRRLEDFDILIASTAKAYSLTLFTKNVKHFDRIRGLKIIS